MNLWNKWTEWRESAKQKRIAAMEQEGKCPECRGRGIHLMPNEYYYTDPLYCPGCDGSGLYSDWSSRHY